MTSAAETCEPEIAIPGISPGLASLHCGSISWLRITSRRLSQATSIMTPLLLPRSLPPAPQPKDQNTRSGTAGEILPRRCHTKLPIYSGVSK
jgi:hypothetical protein